MKSVSKFVFVAATLLFASAASAGTLYWQVNDDNLAGGYGAELWMDDGNGNVTSLSDGMIDVNTGLQQADLTSYEKAGDMSSYSFFVELVNYADYSSTEGYKWSYGDLVSSGYIATGATDVTEVMAAAGAHSNFAVGNAVPEPSSGLLLLIGGAMLALRRRRQK